jgi:hypothetical protein
MAKKKQSIAKKLISQILQRSLSKFKSFSFVQEVFSCFDTSSHLADKNYIEF